MVCHPVFFFCFKSNVSKKAILFSDYLEIITFGIVVWQLKKIKSVSIICFLGLALPRPYDST